MKYPRLGRGIFIPRNKPRIAAAVGKAVSENLLTREDMTDRLTQAGFKEKLTDSIQDALTEQTAPLPLCLPCFLAKRRN